jgi:3-oxoacid CoA-transferase B subunit
MKKICDKRSFIAARVALEFKGGELVNLGVGIPSLVPDFIPADITVYFLSENGIVGFGPDDESLPRDLYRTDASERFVSIVPGGSIVDSCTAFGLIRGGHLAATVLGAMQVDAEGSLANWMVPDGKLAGMGGAMDLVAGNHRVIIATEHCAKDGSPKILTRCTFPLTGYRVVSTIITDLAVIDVTSEGLVLREYAPGVSIEELIAKTDAPLAISPNVREMPVRMEV